MCELFQKKFINSIFDKIKNDTFALDLLKDKLGMDIVECPYDLIGCKKYYVDVTDKKALVRRGFKCPGCDIKMCESCKKFKTVKDSCIDCIIKEKSDTEMYELSCPNCNGNFHTVKWCVGYFCVRCKIFSLKSSSSKKNVQQFSVMSDGLGPEFHNTLSETLESESL